MTPRPTITGAFRSFFIDSLPTGQGTIEVLPNTRHEQRERYARSPSRKGPRSTDRGAPEINHCELSRRRNQFNPSIAASLLDYRIRSRQHILWNCQADPPSGF